MQNPEDVKERVADRIKQLRKRRGWNQEELAHRAGLGRSFVGIIETGRKDLRISTLVKLANTFGIPVSHLLK
jgi:transcriptional regulator with XRE-family HTH domain